MNQLNAKHSRPDAHGAGARGIERKSKTYPTWNTAVEFPVVAKPNQTGRESPYPSTVQARKGSSKFRAKRKTNDPTFVRIWS